MAAVAMVGKHPGLVVWREGPLNAETPLDLLRRASVTPTELFYVRNHGDVPTVDPASYRVEVGGMVERSLSLSLEDLGALPEVTLDAALACAGNRRAELEDAAGVPLPGQIPWGAGAIGSATWTGVRLRDVLGVAGVDPAAAHVAFAGLDAVAQNGRVIEFGGSIPLEKALGEEVLLAHAMNGEPLPPVHGFPLRVVVPGYVGARSVKWLRRIEVRSEPSASFFHAHDYRIGGRALAELAVNAAVCSPLDGETLGGPTVLVQGYAMSGGASRVDRVELSLDDGERWRPTELAGGDGPWTWRFWEAELRLARGSHELAVRAWDSTGDTQPPDAARLWNARGYMNNAWHRVGFTVV
jgi:sulfite oxidase